MPYLFSYGIFISHSWTYSEPYNAMVSLLNNQPFFEYRNFSVPRSKSFAHQPKYALENQLRDQIRPASVVVILGGMWTSYSDWIQFEIDFAKSIYKPILGVRPRGAKQMPTSLSVNANKVVNWNGASIVAAIRELRR